MGQQQESTKKPRIIIIRHSERLDFVLRNSNWLSEVFINGVYSPNRKYLPTFLPLRENPREYLLDTPLTKQGKAHAYRTGEFFRSMGLTPNLIYTSPAMRCVQTADSVLAGLGLRDKRALRIDLALHEPVRKRIPLQSANYYSSVGFHVDLNYRPLLPSNDSRIILDETRLQYYRRLYFLIKGIIRKLIYENPSTVLIVTHRSCVTLLAAMLNLDSIDDKVNYLIQLERNKREEVNFLSMVIAEYDASIGQWTFLSEFPQIEQYKKE